MDEGEANESGSRRERLKQRRAQRILGAAAAVFARKGFHPATIREIAELADVAEGTIYNYFTDKQDLLVAMARHLIANSANAALDQYEGEDDRRFLQMLLADRFQFAAENADFIRALMVHVWQDSSFRQQYLGQVIEPLIELLESRLQWRIEAGGLRPVNTRTVVRAMLGGFLIFLLVSEPGGPGGLQSDLGLSRQELASELADFFLLGLQMRPTGEEVG